MADVVYGRLVVKNTFWDFEEERPTSRRRSHSAPAVYSHNAASVSKTSGCDRAVHNGSQEAKTSSNPVRDRNKSRARRLRRKSNAAAKQVQIEMEDVLWQEYRRVTVREHWHSMVEASLRQRRNINKFAVPRATPKLLDRPVLQLRIERTVFEHVLTALQIGLASLALFMGMGTVRQGEGDEIQLWYNKSIGREPIFEGLLYEAKRFQRARNDNEMVIRIPGDGSLLMCAFDPVRTLRDLKISAGMWCQQPASRIIIKCLGVALAGEDTPIVELGLCPGAWVEVEFETGQREKQDAM